MSERERFRLSGHLLPFGHGGTREGDSDLYLWAKTYPRSSEPFGNLGVDYTYLGQYEKGVEVSLEDLRLNPGSAAAYTNLVSLYGALQRLDEAKVKYDEAVAHKVNNPFLHGNRYGVAFSKTTLPECSNKSPMPPPSLARMCFFRLHPTPKRSMAVRQRHEIAASADQLPFTTTRKRPQVADGRRLA